MSPNGSGNLLGSRSRRKEAEIAAGGMEACPGTHYIARQLAAAADMGPDAV